MTRTGLVLLLVLVLGLATVTRPAWGDSLETVGQLTDRRLPEVSGLAASPSNQGFLWAINDSGDGANLYALGPDGRVLGVFTVERGINRDWEDLAGFRLGDQGYLLIADCGNNDGSSAPRLLYIVREPVLEPASSGERRGSVAVEWYLPYRLPGKAEDCEGVAVDARAERIYLLTKKAGGGVLHALPLRPEREPEEVLVATRLGRMEDRGFCTALDFSPDGRRALVLSYRQVQVLERAPGEASWDRALLGRAVWRAKLPRLELNEAACFSSDGGAVFVTAEGLPAPVYRAEMPR